MSDTLTRTAADTTVPVAGTYQLDPSHSSADFQVRHLGLSKVRGGFAIESGTVVIGEDPTQSSVEVSLDAASFSTGAEDRDTHVKSADFLDIEQFPKVTFRSTGVRQSGDDWKVDGDLTVKDVTRPVTLDVEFEGANKDPWGNGRIAFAGETEINREDFGITWNQALETGGVLVGKNVKIVIDVQAVAEG
ncbi:MAG TPA: polyisoprenoid-binding protein [Acidimicrobiaceae bacterium]|nr:polyisoprenoid-binding protein [Acidimicrobiaceae bacterium]